MDWNAFCSTDFLADTFGIGTPFVAGSYRYATNARVSIRQKHGGPPVPLSREGSVRKLVATYDCVSFADCSIPLPTPHPDRHVYTECPEDCDTCECSRYRGGGCNPAHDPCRKSVEVRAHVWLRFDGLLVDGRYLALIHEHLTHPLYARPERNNAPIRIVADGGYELLLAVLRPGAKGWTIRDASDGGA